MIPFFVKRFLAELRKESHRLNNLGFMDFYRSQLLIEDGDYTERVKVCLSYQRKLVVKKNQAGVNIIYESYKELPRKIIDPWMREKAVAAHKAFLKSTDFINRSLSR